MKHLTAFSAGVIIVVALSTMDRADAKPIPHRTQPAEWRTVGRGALAGDSLMVRALWGFDLDAGESTFVKYRIEDSRGKVLQSDTLSDGGWCESLDARFTPWRSGVRVEMGGTFYPCPGECSSMRYVYLARDTAAVSEWFWSALMQFEFDERGRTTAWTSENGMFWRMRLEPVIDREKLTFGVNLSKRALAGNPILVDVKGRDCVPRQADYDSLITIFPTPASNSGQRVLVPLGTESKFLTGMVVVDRSMGDVPLPHLRRVEIEIANQRGWIDVDDLQVFGCTSEP